MPMQSPHVRYQGINGSRRGRSFERGAKILRLDRSQ
jgi:hypothetical protein